MKTFPPLDHSALRLFPKPSNKREAARLLHIAAGRYRLGYPLDAERVRSLLDDVSLAMACEWLEWLSWVMPTAWERVWIDGAVYQLNVREE